MMILENGPMKASSTGALRISQRWGTGRYRTPVINRRVSGQHGRGEQGEGM
jgi:hypothetical protein